MRRQLDLSKISPLRAIDLADHLGITVWSVGDIHGTTAEDMYQLTVRDSDSWSALTLALSGRHLIVVNPSQSASRINSVMMHELSHIILGHNLHHVGVTEDGQLVPGNYEKDQEDEADWLGGTLLLPRPALIEIRRQKLSNFEAGQHYLASNQMLIWRFRMTGVDYQIANAKSSKIRRKDKEKLSR